MFGKKTTGGSFLISIIIHGIAIVILMFYVFRINEKIEKTIEAVFYEPKPKTTPRPRQKHIPKIAPKPVVQTQDFIPSGNVKADSPRTALVGTMQSATQPATVTEYSNRRLTQGSPSALKNNQMVTQVATAAKIAKADNISLSELSALGTASKGTGLLSDKAQAGGSDGSAGSGKGRGTFGSGSEQGGSGSTLDGKRVGLSISDTTNTTTITDTLEDITQSMSLGDRTIPPLPKGEPGGRVIGKGKDIKGVFRLVRLKHDLADWWDDSTSILGIVKWLNGKTQIRADMNVEGGSLNLTDTNLLKAPLAIMTGHDPALVRPRLSRFRQVGSINMQERMTQAERVALRKYLLEKGGMIFFDECGHNSVSFPLKRKLISELKAALPEYFATSIPNKHELYYCYYNLGGPPVGAAQFWTHGVRGPIPKYLQALVIDGRLAVVFSGRDYLCAAETINVHSGKISKVSSAYRFLTNVVVYALTHGKISDYSDYIPEDNSKAVITPQKAPVVPQATPQQ